MKKQPFTHFTGMINHELEAKLEAIHNEGLKHADELGLHYSKQNRPEPKGDSLEVYTNPFRSKYEGMKILVGQTLQVESVKAETKIIQEESNRIENELREKVKNAETQKHNLEHDINKKGVSTDILNHLKPKKKIDWWIVLISFTETSLNIGGLQLIGNNWLVSLIISCGITTALFMLAKYLAKFLKENTVSSKIKITMLIAASCLALGIFYLLASLSKIIIEKEFKGSLQAFATDSIIVHKNVTLSYPSVLGLVRNEKSPAVSSILLSENDTLLGNIFSYKSNTDVLKQTGVVIQDKAIVYGQVYSNGYVDIKGTIYGSLMCSKIILSTPSSVYENHLLNAVIDITKLSKHYVEINLVKESETKKVVKWLE